MNTSWDSKRPLSKPQRVKESCLSPDTRGLIKGNMLPLTVEFMKASKLTNQQQKFLDEIIRDGTAFPSHPETVGKPSRSVLQLLSNPLKAKIPFQDRPRIRTLEKIKQTGAFEMDVYRPIAKSM